MISPQVAANVAVFLFSLMAAIQVLVALAILPCTILWGGSQQVLTPSLRLASVMACLLLLGMAKVVRLRIETDADWVRRTCWGISAYMVLNTAGNLTSPNPVERYAFGALTAVLAVTCGIVASRREDEDTMAYEPVA